MTPYGALGVVLAMALITLYWLPTIFAVGRHSKNVAQIAIVNGLLGFTLVGWVVALVMAFKPVEK